MCAPGGGTGEIDDEDQELMSRRKPDAKKVER